MGDEEDAAKAAERSSQEGGMGIKIKWHPRYQVNDQGSNGCQILLMSKT